MFLFNDKTEFRNNILRSFLQIFYIYYEQEELGQSLKRVKLSFQTRNKLLDTFEATDRQ